MRRTTAPFVGVQVLVKTIVTVCLVYQQQLQQTTTAFVLPTKSVRSSSSSSSSRSSSSSSVLLPLLLFKPNHGGDSINIINNNDVSSLDDCRISHQQQNDNKPMLSIPMSCINGVARTTWMGLMIMMMTTTTLTTTTILPFSANAYETTDYASETVQTAVQELQRGAGNIDATFKAYENIAGIITEGKGVGGMVNYQGIELERGYVSDEDTTIYNPGLTLLTESEKERLVEAVIDSRRVGLAGGQWSENNEFAYEFLKGSLDPYHMVELAGYLKVVPFYGAILYLAVLGVQQFARDAFTVAYLAGAALFFLPILAFVAAGP